MVGMIMAFPSLVTGNIDKVKSLTDAEVMQQLDIRPPEEGEEEEAGVDAAPAAGEEEEELRPPEDEDDLGQSEEDPMKALQEAIRKDRK